MRITTNAIVRTSLGSVQDNLRRAADAQLQATTGLRVRRPSDDPGAAAQVLGADRGLRALTQYQRNIDGARTRLVAEESALTQLGDLLSRARELALAQANATSDAASMDAALKETDALFSAAVQLGNTMLGDSYLFGGVHAHQRPFSDEGVISNERPPVGSPAVQVGAEAYAPVNHDGQTAFIDTGALAALHALRNALAAGESAALRDAAGELVGAFDDVQSLIGEVGTRTNRLELASANVEALEFNLRTLRSDLAEVDIEVALTEMISRQTTLQAAMAAATRALSTTLTDYL